MQAHLEKAKKVRLLILDVDGVLTSGLIYYTEQGAAVKAFHVHDGLGIKLLQRAGIEVAVISAKSTAAVQNRLNDLNIQYQYLGYENKLPAYEELKNKLQLEDHAIAYMGDDLPDLPLLKRVGFAITVPSAPAIIKQHIDFVTQKKGGKGAVREVCEFILTAQDKLQSVLQSYFIK